MLKEKMHLQEIINELIVDHQKLVKTHEALRANSEKLCSLLESLQKRLASNTVPFQRGSATSQNSQAIRETQQMNMSFNMQYLQLQQQMQNYSRQFVLVSNIMKAKHETAKNVINNIR